MPYNLIAKTNFGKPVLSALQMNSQPHAYVNNKLKVQKGCQCFTADNSFPEICKERVAFLHSRQHKLLAYRMKHLEQSGTLLNLEYNKTV